MSHKIDQLALESPYLQGFMKSFMKRSKAMKHKVKTYELSKEFEEGDNVVYERFNVDFTLWGAQPPTIRLSLWDDRWLWIDVRQRSKRGWVFECQHEGRIGDCPYEKIVGALEESIALLAEAHKSRDICLKLRDMWNKIAIAGPLRLLKRHEVRVRAKR